MGQDQNWIATRRLGRNGCTRLNSTAGVCSSTSTMVRPRSIRRTALTTRTGLKRSAIPSWASQPRTLELVACDDAGLPSFRTLMELGNKALALCLWCFDLLHLGNDSLLLQPLDQRKHLLTF